MKRKHDMHIAKIVVTVVVLATLFFVYDLIAKEAPTELEMYQDIYSQIDRTDDADSSSAATGRDFLLHPVEKVKNNAEEYVLRRKGVITHDEMEGNSHSRREMFKHRSDGPKISLTF